MDLMELEALALQEMSQHGLQGWTFALVHTKRRLGVCKYRSKRIEIAEYYARNNARAMVVDTLLHEIAHALAGPNAAHGPKWKAIAARLGADPRACNSSIETVMTPGAWQATCPVCRMTYHRHRRPKSLNAYRCRCASRSPLLFRYMGDPARQPEIPRTVEESAHWQARCTGCGTIHRRIRRPQPGLWRCKCPRLCEIVWQFQPPRPQTEISGST